jgi:hypothetical protein
VDPPTDPIAAVLGTLGGGDEETTDRSRVAAPPEDTGTHPTLHQEPTVIFDLSLPETHPFVKAEADVAPPPPPPRPRPHAATLAPGVVPPPPRPRPGLGEGPEESTDVEKESSAVTLHDDDLELLD